jgi:hypothetical protein
MVRARRPLVLLAACLGLAAVAGCAAASSSRPSGAVKAGASPSVTYVVSISAVPPAARPTSPLVTPPPKEVNVAAFDALARQEAAAWARSPLPKPGSSVSPDPYGTPSEKLGPLGAGFVGIGPVWPSTSGRMLTVGVVVSPCDLEWGGLVAEVGGVVVVGGWRSHPRPERACSALLDMRRAAVRLAAPLGHRVVLDAATGRPVTLEPVSAAP